jgi:hypothetical protein
MTKEELRAVRELLVRARARIEDPARWCRDYSAMDAAGLGVAGNSVAACKWCADGAIIAEIGGTMPGRHTHLGYGAMTTRLRTAANDLYALDHIDTNDQHGHEAAVAIYDRAINKTLDEEAALAGVTA